MITLRLEGSTSIIASLKSMPHAVYVALMQKTEALAVMLQSYIRTDKLSGQVLNARTGDLRRSIQKAVMAAPGLVIGRIFSSGDVKYAGIHEYGGRTAAHVIMPNKAQALSFMMGGKRVVFAMVNHPGSQMPERSYMRTGLADKREEITIGLKEAAFFGLTQAMEGS